MPMVYFPLFLSYFRVRVWEPARQQDPALGRRGRETPHRLQFTQCRVVPLACI